MVDDLGLGDVIALHNRLMTRLGYPPPPLRGAGGLESAVMRPSMAAYYQDADLVRQTALLAAGIAQAQTFLDGNKRTAYLATDLYLWINGAEFVGDFLGLAQLPEGIADRSEDRDHTIDNLDSWVRDWVTPRS